MKTLIIGIFALTSLEVSAQALTVPGFSALLSERKATLEAVNAGMSKRVDTTASFVTETGKTCQYTQSALQSVLKVDGEKMIVLSQEKFTPVASEACTEAQLEAFEEKILFYENKPSLAADIADLNAAAATVRSITRAGDLVTMVVNGETVNPDGSTGTELVTVQYDLRKSSFKNLVSTQTSNYRSTTSDVADIDVNSVDLRQVVFCASSAEDEQDCVEGDFSDILY